MNPTIHLHRGHHTRAELEERFAALGFVPGRPPQLANVSYFIDHKAARSMLCPGCHRKGLHAEPYHKGERLKILAACCHCDAAEEV